MPSADCAFVRKYVFISSRCASQDDGAHLWMGGRALRVWRSREPSYGPRSGRGQRRKSSTAAVAPHRHLWSTCKSDSMNPCKCGQSVCELKVGDTRHSGRRCASASRRLLRALKGPCTAAFLTWLDPPYRGIDDQEVRSSTPQTRTCSVYKPHYD